MWTPFGLSSTASEGRTCWMSPADTGFTMTACVQVFPPSAELTKRIFEFAVWLPKLGDVELLQARYTMPLRAAMDGCSVIREAFTYLGKPNSPGPAFRVPWTVNRRFVPPQSVS